MSAGATSFALGVGIPRRIRLSLAMLWVAWGISLCAYAIHAYRLGVSGGDLYSIIGIPAALLQALLLYLIGKRNNAARLIALWLAIPAAVIALVFFSDQVSSVRFALEDLLRGVALALLLTPGAAQWFK